MLTLGSGLVVSAMARPDYFTTSMDSVGGAGYLLHHSDGGGLKRAYSGGMSEPISVATGLHDMIYVADYLGSSVYVFFADGELLTTIPVPDYPGSLVVHPDGSLLVARYDGGPIYRFAADGTAMPNFTDDTGLIRHGQMCFDTAGDLYVCSWVENRILKYDSAGGSLGVFSDTATSGVDGPVGIATDEFGGMYVAEYATHELKYLLSDGTLGAVLGTTPDEPEYLTLDNGTLLVPQHFSGTVDRYDLAGGFMGQFAAAPLTYQTVPGPHALTVDDATILLGSDGGGESNLVNLDGSGFRVCKFIVPNMAAPGVRVDVVGSDASDPLPDNVSSLSLFMRSSMVTPGAFRLRVAMVDENNVVSTTVVDDGPIGTTPKDVWLDADDPSLYVRSDGSVKMRYEVFQTGPVTVSLWCHTTDYISWHARP